MANTIKDLTGQRAGRLTVLSLLGKIKSRAVWKCRCDCGEIAIVRGSYLSRAIKGNGGTKSCGCLPRENGIENLRRMRERNTQ